MIPRDRHAHCLRLLSREERAGLAKQAETTGKLERNWKRKFDAQIDQYDSWVFREMDDGDGRFDVDAIDFREIVARHSFEVASAGERDARETLERNSSLAKAPPPIVIPRSFRDLRSIYDRWKRKGKLPPHQQAIADRLKKFYLKRCRTIWERYSEEFREGEEFSQAKVKEILRTQGDMAKARAETIANTETTNYYNAARRNVYDRSPDVTNYLFVAIRDRATTPWCRSRQGLVFTKGTKLCDHNTPACHWNCRSEMLPLSPANPRHLRLIENMSLRAENNKLVPLPPGWRSAA